MDSRSFYPLTNVTGGDESFDLLLECGPIIVSGHSLKGYTAVGGDKATPVTQSS